MKNFLLISFFVLSIGLCSCSSDGSIHLDLVDGQQQYFANDSISLLQLERCKAYVTSHPELFGENILIFDSPEQLFRELDTLNMMDYKCRRAWQREHTFYNPILNSLIVLDSVQTAVFDRYGIAVLDTLGLDSMHSSIDDVLYAEALEEYENILEKECMQYLNATEEDGEIYYHPLGALDDQVFMNQKGLYACSGIVYKKLIDGQLSCSYNDYRNYVNCSTVAQVKEVINNVSTSNTSTNEPEPVVIEDSQTRWTFLDKYYSVSPDYRMEIEFKIVSTNSLFVNWRKVVMRARNYHMKEDSKGKKEFYPHLCETKITAHVTTDCPFTDSWTIVPFRTGWCPMGTGSYYFREKIFKKCSCNQLQFTYIAVDAINRHGCVIKMSNGGSI